MPALLHSLRIALITDPLTIICIVLMGITTAFVSLFESKSYLQHKVAAFWSRVMLFSSGVKVTVTGLENIPAARACVLVSNHASLLDIPVIYGHLPVPFRFMAKTSLFRVPFIGWHLHRGGHIRVLREDKRASAKALASARRILNDGTSVHIFAEGSRSGGRLQEFKAGAALVAAKSGAPIVPIGITGTGARLPRGSIHIRPGEVHLSVGKPIPTNSQPGRDHKAITASLQESVAALIAETEQTTN